MKEPIELMHEDFQVHVDSDWVGDLLGSPEHDRCGREKKHQGACFDVKRKQDHV